MRTLPIRSPPKYPIANTAATAEPCWAETKNSAPAVREMGAFIAA